MAGSFLSRTIRIDVRANFGRKGNMADVVKSVLESIAEKEAQYKPIEVQKDLDVEIDEGNLLAIDSNVIDTKSLRYHFNIFPH